MYFCLQTSGMLEFTPIHWVGLIKYNISLQTSPRLQRERILVSPSLLGKGLGVRSVFVFNYTILCSLSQFWIRSKQRYISMNKI